jgi:hypothetical protein
MFAKFKVSEYSVNGCFLYFKEKQFVFQFLTTSIKDLFTCYMFFAADKELPRSA